MPTRRLALIAALLMAAPAWAQGRGNGGDHGGGQGNGRGQGGGQGREQEGGQGRGRGNRGRGPQPSLGQPEIGIVRSWYETGPGWAPVALPPGQRRRLASGKPLPPGIARQALPAGLAARLPAYPGYRYVAIGQDLVLIAIATGVVASILSGAFSP